MSVLTIGRVGIDVEVADVEAWDMDGNTISAAGLLVADSVSSAKVLRQQLTGYVDNPDEPVVPVTWTEDGTVDGFYRVRSAKVSTTGPATLVSGMFEFSLTLERVNGYATPIVETVVVGDVRDNSHSITSASALAAVAVPDDVTEFWDTSEPTDLEVVTRTASSGDVRVAITDTYSRRQQWAVPPHYWYHGAATVTHGSAGLAVVGRQVPVHSDTYGYGSGYGSGGYGDWGENTWTLSNGLLRVSLVTGGFALEAWDGTAWSTAKVIAPTAVGASWGTVQPASGLRVLRNSPAECIIRVPLVVSHLSSAVGSGSWRVDIDVALRRGDLLARFFIASTLDVGSLGVEMETDEAATALTGGIRATANDADGNRYVLASPHAITTDLTVGRIVRTGPTEYDRFAFAAGLEVGGSAATGFAAAQSLIYQYMGATSERVVVASR